MKKSIIYLSIISAVVWSCKQNVEHKNIQQESTIEQTASFQIPDLTEIASALNGEDDIQIYTVKIGNDPDKSHLTASFPITAYDFVNQSEKQFTEKLVEEFKAEFKERKDKEAVSGLDFNQHFEVKVKNNNFLVFLYTQNVSYGNNYDTRNTVSIFDLKNKKKLAPQDLFNNQEDFKNFAQEMKNLAWKQIEARLENDKSIANEQEKEQLRSSMRATLEEGTLPKNENYDGLYFDEKGNWHLIFDKYQIASGVMGEFIIDIPKKIIDQYIRIQGMDTAQHETAMIEEMEEAPLDHVPSSVDCSQQPCVALTFDDGPSVYTPELLDILKKENVKATFFVLGKSASVQKNTMKRIAEEGHNIGNHSYDHKDFRKLSHEEAKRQIQLTDETIQEITGKKPKYFRFPYGAYTKENLQMVGRPVMMWNIDPLDWKHKDADLVAKAMSKASPKSIILAHDIHKTTVKAIPQVIKNLKDQGYHIVTLDELFRHKTMTNGAIYFDGE